jgi:hypothetical protein
MRGQASMEFLMTYGWAILVVLAAIATLAYFGVLSPDRFLPQKCSMAPGIDCAEHKITPNSITIALRNGMGKHINITHITVGTCSWSPANQTFNNGDLRIFNSGAVCSNGVVGDRFRGDIVVSYVDRQTGIAKSTDGSVVAKVLA